MSKLYRFVLRYICRRLMNPPNIFATERGIEAYFNVMREVFTKCHGYKPDQIEDVLTKCLVRSAPPPPLPPSDDEWLEILNKLNLSGTNWPNQFCYTTVTTNIPKKKLKKKPKKKTKKPKKNES